MVRIGQPEWAQQSRVIALHRHIFHAVPDFVRRGFRFAGRQAPTFAAHLEYGPRRCPTASSPQADTPITFL